MNVRDLTSPKSRLVGLGELALAYYRYGDRKAKEIAVSVWCMCWAEQIRQNQQKGT